MKVNDLPRLGVITNPLDGDLFGQWSDLSGKNLLCLGMSEAQIDTFIAPHLPRKVTLLTLWADHKDAQSSKYPLSVGDITQKTDFGTNEFDAVLTMSVLEHVSALGAAFNEMARVVRPGGEMLHIFGPAWSCAYGHHLCGKDDDPNLVFFRWQMPAHMHLLCDESEVCEYYEGLDYDSETGKAVFDQMHNHDQINRVNYDDYVAIMQTFQVARTETMYNVLPDDHLRALRRAVPGCQDFSTYGGCYKLIVQ